MRDERHACDVLVAGGGSAGLAAAVAAARTGASVVLVERTGTLGGTVAQSLVHSICGLYLLRDGPGAVPANGGLAMEVAQRLLAVGGASGPWRMGRVDVLLQQPSAFEAVAARLTAECPSLRVLYHARAGRATVEGGRLTGVEIVEAGGAYGIGCAAAVDATGDGHLAVAAGAEFFIEEPERLQRPAIIFALAGVAEGALDDEGRLRIAHALAAAVRRGALPGGVLGAALRAIAPGQALVTIDLDPPGMTYDPLDAGCLAEWEVYGRKLGGVLADFLRANGAGFAGSHVTAWPSRIGVRESRRIRGEVCIETEDVAWGRCFEDAVGVASWPMEIRERASGPRWRYPAGNRPCDIPLRALKVCGVENLFVAGRCVSSSHLAQAALRVIGTCLVMGEAAGLAAARMAKGHPWDAVRLAAEVRAARAAAAGGMAA